MRWLSDGEVVSASTDSTLRLWDIHAARESRVFRGHVNEKNFVGLAADSEFIACGSETNEVASLSQPQTVLSVALRWTTMLQNISMQPVSGCSLCLLPHICRACASAFSWHQVQRGP